MHQEAAKGNAKPFKVTPPLYGEHHKQNPIATRLELLAVGFFRSSICLFFRYSFRLFPGPLGYGPLLCMYVLLPFLRDAVSVPSSCRSDIGPWLGLIGASGFFSGIVEPRTFIKVFGSLILPYFYYWYLWLYLGKDVIRGFRIYLKGAQIVSVFGLLIFADSIVSFGFFRVHKFSDKHW